MSTHSNTPDPSYWDRLNNHVPSVAEVAYAIQWQQMMSMVQLLNGSTVSPLVALLTKIHHPLTKRAIRLLNTLAMWVGSPEGRRFSGRHSGYPINHVNYQHAWNAANLRRLVNGHPVRLLELICMNRQPNPDQPMILPQLGVRDYEIAEAFFIWLSSPEGCRFIHESETRAQTFGYLNARMKVWTEEDASHHHYGIQHDGYVLSEAQADLPECGVVKNRQYRLYFGGIEVGLYCEQTGQISAGHPKTIRRHFRNPLKMTTAEN